MDKVWLLIVFAALFSLGFYQIRKNLKLKKEVKAVMEEKMGYVEPPVVVDFMDVSNAKDIPLQVFDDMFDAGRIIIEKETYGFTRNFWVWANSDARFSVPLGANMAFQLVSDLGVGFATAATFMYEGIVFSFIKDSKNLDIKMFSDEASLREYAKTLFAIFLVYEGVSPIDRNTKRYYIVGCLESDGVVPTHGL